MNQKNKLYRIRRNGKHYITLIPGRYAGNITHKIFGRLDCESGKRMKKENRVFFASWEDALAAGYRPCKNCQPRYSDKYPPIEDLKEALLARPHIALWKSGPPPNRRRPGQAWYVALNWQDKNSKKGNHCQITLSNWFVYGKAREIAVRMGKKYNLPVLQHGPADFANIWIPVEKTNDIDRARDRKALKELLKSKKVIGFPSMF